MDITAFELLLYRQNWNCEYCGTLKGGAAVSNGKVEHDFRGFFYLLTPCECYGGIVW